MLKTYQDLLKKVSDFKLDQNQDLSSGENLSIGIMNLISIEEHLFYTSQKLKSPKYLKILNEVRLMRTELMREIVKDPKGEVWCISKHLLAASMRIMEVGTKKLKSGDQKSAESLFKKSYELYSLFWGLNLTSSKSPKSPQSSKLESGASVFDKINDIVQHALDCCRE